MIIPQIIFKCKDPNQTMASSSAEEQQKTNKFETGNLLDIEGMGQLLSSTNFIFHLPGMSPMDRNTHKQFFNSFTSSFPDLRHEIVDLVAEGDKVAVRYDVTGTHKGELQGIPPTGKKVSFTAMDFKALVNDSSDIVILLEFACQQLNKNIQTTVWKIIEEIE